MEQRLYEALQSNPIIAAVRDDEGLEACLQADVQTVFVLYGDICGIAGIVRRIKDAGKIAIVHADLITACREGDLRRFSAQHHAGRRDHLDPHQHDPAGEGAADDRHSAGVSDRLHGVRRGSGRTESQAGRHRYPARADAIDDPEGPADDGHPGFDGGLITEKREVMQALEAGALAISSTAPDVWQM